MVCKINEKTLIIKNLCQLNKRIGKICRGDIISFENARRSHGLRNGEVFQKLN